MGRDTTYSGEEFDFIFEERCWCMTVADEGAPAGRMMSPGQVNELI